MVHKSKPISGLITNKKLLSLFKNKQIRVVFPIRDEEFKHLTECKKICKNYHILKCIIHNLNKIKTGKEFELYPLDSKVWKICNKRPIIATKEDLDSLHIHNLHFEEELRKLTYDLRELPDFYIDTNPKTFT